MSTGLPEIAWIFSAPKRAPNRRIWSIARSSSQTMAGRIGSPRPPQRARGSFGVLFEIARARLGERDCGTSFSHRRAGPIPGNRLGGCGRGIDSDDKVARHARAQQPEPRRTCASASTDAGILEKTGIFRFGVDHLLHRVHALLRIAA